MVLIVVVLLVGLAGRVWLASLAPRYAYLIDAFGSIGHGLTVEPEGLLKAYTLPVQRNIPVHGQQWSKEQGRFVPYSYTFVRQANYPPVGLTFLWLHVELLRLLDPTLQANTFGSRLVMSAGAILADAVMAAAALLLGRELFGRRAGLLAGGLTWLFPPLAMNSSFWGQVDSWVQAPMLLALWLMLRRRWLAAGVLIGLAVQLKPQGLLMGPVALFAAAMIATAAGGRPRPGQFARRIGLGAAGALGLVLLAALPWMLADGWAWYRRSIAENFAHFPYTTLKAFNVWYVEAMVLDSQHVAGALDATRQVAGASKDDWGRLLVLTSMVILAGLCWWRGRRRPQLAVVAFAALWLWSTFIWPTRVHERYFVLAVPPVIVLAAALRRFWPAVLILAVVGVAEVTWNLWLPLGAGYSTWDPPERLHAVRVSAYRQQTAQLPPGSRPPPPAPSDSLAMYWRHYDQRRAGERPWEVLFTALSLAGYACTCAALAARPLESGSENKPQRAQREQRTQSTQKRERKRQG